MVVEVVQGEVHQLLQVHLDLVAAELDLILLYIQTLCVKVYLTQVEVVEVVAV